MRLDLNGRAVSKHFGNALHHFRSVVAEANYRIRTVLGRMHQQQLVGFDACPFAEIGQNGDISANDRLQSRTQISDYAARTHDNPSYHSEIANDPITR